MKQISWKVGQDVTVGDVLDYTSEGFQIVRFGEYNSPLIPITGPGRIAYNYRDDPIVVYDQHFVRLRISAPTG